MLFTTMFYVTWLVLQLYCDFASLDSTAVYGSKVNPLFFRFEQSRQKDVTILGLRRVTLIRQSSPTRVHMVATVFPT